MYVKDFETRQRIGRTIRSLRVDNDMSQQQLADMAHITRSNLSKIENGSYGTSLDVLSSIAQVLGKRIDFV